MTEALLATRPTSPEYRGDEQEQRLAREVFELLCSSARFFPLQAPIRVPLSALAEHFAHTSADATEAVWSDRLKRALEANAHIFALETNADGSIVVATTRAGTPPVPPEALIDTLHQLPRRFMEPPAESLVSPRVHREALVAPAAEEVAAPEEREPEAAVAAAAVLHDLTGVPDEVVAAAIRATLRDTDEVIGFGDEWAIADLVPRLSRGDVRRIREYIIERGEPLSDTELLEIVLNVRSDAPDYALQRFALNARLQQEEGFEFVGVPGAFTWTVREVNPVPAPNRRPADIGQDYRYLLEETETPAPGSETLVDHVLTFYEHYYGVLPYGGPLLGVLPDRVLPEQTRALLRFEAPQTHETFFVELRFPTANRGGFLHGFQSFFAANLVPGALITIERGERSGSFVIDYLPISRQERRLLTLDEKQRKYVFKPVTFFCAVQDSMLLTEQRFPRFAGQEPLDERTRRAYDRVLEITFERVGENVGSPDEPRYMATLDDLVAGVNVERPLSGERIRRILESEEFPQFAPDPEVSDLYYYTPKR